MKILFYTTTGITKPYPRSDDEPVVGLSADYKVFDLIDSDRPAHDTSTHYVRRLPEVIDTKAKTVTRGWELVEKVVSPRAAMAAAFDALPLPVQAAFYAARLTAEGAMDRGRYDIARAVIEAQPVPPELETTKASILAHFPL